MEQSARDDAESEAERLERNWDDLLQELRVTQTGIQILFGFLLTLPFQTGFDRLDGLDHDLYAVIVGLVTVSTFLNLTPVMAHRVLFRQGQKRALVHMSGNVLMLSLNLLGLALALAVCLIVRVVFGGWQGGFLAGAAVALTQLSLWLVLPRMIRD